MSRNRQPGPPDLLIVGHVVQDLLPDGSWRLGGTASYAAVMARSLGLRAAVITACAPDLPLDKHLPDVDIIRLPSDRSTQFRNEYTPQGRVQSVPQRAEAIAPEAVPDDWRSAGIVLLGPVASEVDEALAGCFPGGLVGACVQGWLRHVGPDGRVRPVPPRRWRADRLLEGARVLFCSDEDIAPGDQDVLHGWSRRLDVVAYTRGEQGADVCCRGEWRHIDAFPADVTDLTGAGDVFATAFLVRYRETGDAWEALRYGSAAASLIIECEGISAPPDRAAVEARLRANPEVVARTTAGPA